MKNSNIHKHYNKLTDPERVELAILAVKRGDREELKRLMSGGEIKITNPEEEGQTLFRDHVRSLTHYQVKLLRILFKDKITNEERDEQIFNQVQEMQEERRWQERLHSVKPTKKN